MKYRVSLLPEKNRKRLIGKKKAEKGKGIINVILLVLLAVAFVSVCCKVGADAKLKEIKNKNVKYQDTIQEMEHLKGVASSVKAKIDLINSITVDEPSMYNFFASLSNIDHPGISVNQIEMIDWKSSRLCNISGKADSRDALLQYCEAIRAIEGVGRVEESIYTVEIVNGEEEITFLLIVSCNGGKGSSTVDVVADQ